jgi:hypothetical protein
MGVVPSTIIYSQIGSGFHTNVNMEDQTVAGIEVLEQVKSI